MRIAPPSGQILRRLGLLTEAACLLGLLALARGRLPAEPYPGGPANHLTLKIGLAVGFALWAAGTLRIYWPPARRRDPADRDDPR